jgi:hypothetical protein
MSNGIKSYLEAQNWVLFFCAHVSPPLGVELEKPRGISNLFTQSDGLDKERVPSLTVRSHLT